MKRRIAAGVGSWLGLVLGVVSLAQAQAPAWPTEAPPRPLAARQVTLPPYEVRTLANGLQVVAVPHHEQPAIAMRLLVRAGAAQDPATRPGVAYLTAQLLDQGTKTRTAEQIADAIDSIGGVLSTGSSADLTSANVVVMKDSFETGMRLLYDVVHDPAFAPQEIDRQKQQILSSLLVNRDDPGYIATSVFDRLVYGPHPYGTPAAGTPQTLAAITRSDLAAFHERYFVPNNMILAVVGDVTRDDAFAMVDTVFAGWPASELARPAVAEPPPATRRVVIVDKPDAVQTEIRVGQLAIPRRHADYLAWDLAVKILGGEGANRLHRLLRSERGLTYGAAAELDAMQQAGDYMAETSTRTATTGDALRLMVDEFARLPRQRVYESELAAAQAYLAGSFPLTIETPNQIATQVLNTVFYGLPIDDLATFRERVLAMTPDDVQRVAKAYVHPDRLAVVLVGNARAFAPQLQSVGISDYEVIPAAQLDLMSPTLRRPSPQAARITGPAVQRVVYRPAQSRAAEDPAIAAVRRAIDAKGGMSALRGMKTLVADATTVLQTRPPLTATTRSYVVYPDRFRIDAPLPGGITVVQVYDRGKAWMSDPNGVTDAPPAMRDDFAAGVRRDIVSLLLGAIDGDVRVRALPTDGDSRVLEFSGRDLGPVRLYFDRDWLVTRETYTVTIEGTPVAAEEVFSDYRTVSGVKVPFQAEVRRAGSPVVSRTLTNVSINAPVDPALFDKPQR